MSRKLKAVVVLLMLALLPVRALAAVTSGFCALVDHDSPAHSHASKNGDSHHFPHESSPCSSCVEHCSSAAFAPSSPAAPVALPAAAERSLLDERSVAGFIPDHLDPPPLAL